MFPTALLVFLLATSEVLALIEDNSSLISASKFRGHPPRHLAHVDCCETSSDCLGSNKYCSTKGFCLENGSCEVSADCDITEGYPFGESAVDSPYCWNDCLSGGCATACEEGITCTQQEDCPFMYYCSTGATCLNDGLCNVNDDCDIIEGYPFGEFAIDDRYCWNDCLSGECATACEEGKACSDQEDCPSMQYCSTGATCLNDGLCNVNDDCDIIEGYPFGEFAIDDRYCWNDCLSGECATACEEGKACSDQEDCPAMQYCSTGGTCLNDGSCKVNGDCNITEGYPFGQVGLDDPLCWNDCLSGECATACEEGKACSDQEDCPAMQYCSTGGTCLNDGSCKVNGDCNITEGYPFGQVGLDDPLCWNDCLSGECATACEEGKACSNQEDCPAMQYCSTGGTCLKDGSCKENEDCDIIEGYPFGQVGLDDPLCWNDCLSGECATACE